MSTAVAGAAAASGPIIVCKLEGPSTGCRLVEVSADFSKPAPPEVRDDASGPYSYEYTGKHDHGELPATSDNYYAHMVAALRDAKASTDVILAAAVKADAELGRPPSPKRARSGDA